MRRTAVGLNIHTFLTEYRLKVLESSHFFGLYLFEVVGIDVVPKLPKKGLIRMVVNIGLWVSNLEVGACYRSLDAIEKMEILARLVSKMEVTALGVNPDQLLKHGHAL